MNTALNRTTIAYLTNKSGGDLSYGAVVVLDNTNANGFTTTTTDGLSTRGLGVILDAAGIANNATGAVAIGGWCPKITLNTAATVGQFIKTYTAAGQGTPHSSPQVEGDFAVALSASSTPSCLLFGSPNPPPTSVTPGLVLLEQHTASTSASLDFTTFITSTYDNYMIQIVNLVPASDAGIWMLVSTDGGGTWSNSGYSWATWYASTNATSSGIFKSGSTSAFTLWQTVESTSSAGLSGRIVLNSPLSASFGKYFVHEGVAQQDSGDLYAYHGGLRWTTSTAVTALRFQASTGNLASGTIRAYGIAK